MPVIRITALSPADGAAPALAPIALAVAEALDVPPRQVWVVFQPVAPGHYVEGAIAAERQPRDTHPPIVEILAAAGRPAEASRRMLERAAAATAEVFDVDGDAPFVVLRELPPGTVLAGGRVR